MARYDPNPYGWRCGCGAAMGGFRTAASARRYLETKHLPEARHIILSGEREALRAAFIWENDV